MHSGFRWHTVKNYTIEIEFLDDGRFLICTFTDTGIEKEYFTNEVLFWASLHNRIQGDCQARMQRAMEKTLYSEDGFPKIATEGLIFHHAPKNAWFTYKGGSWVPILAELPPPEPFFRGPV